MNKQKLLEKYLRGECSPEELRRLYQHLREDSANEYEALLAELWQQLSLTHSLSPTASARLYEGVVAATHGLEAAPRSRRRWLRAAAVAGLLLAAGWLFGLWLFPAYTTYQTAYGEIKQITLPDSSVVDLNANSQLKVASAFLATSPREVWLTGEAYFHVRPRQSSANEAIKFVVHTTHLDVEVLGTTFNVKDRRGATDVVLNSGRVLLRKQADHTQALAMEPGDKVRLDPAQDFVLTHVPEPAIYASWKEHELYFADQTLAAIQQELADSYDLHLRFGDPALARLRFTGSAPTDDLTILLNTIRKSFNLTLTPTDDGYLLSS